MNVVTLERTVCKIKNRLQEEQRLPTTRDKSMSLLLHVV